MKKPRFLKTHFLPPVQKKIFPYIKTLQSPPGLSNNRIRSWFASLSRSILIRWTGITALKYLSRYLYRGVISEKNIVSNQNGQVTFKYIQSKTANTRYRTLKGEDFLHLIIQHVLPKGFRKLRDYGFLHGNAKKTLSLIQLILHVVIKGIELRPRPAFKCPCCKSPMVIIGFRQTAWEPG